MPEAVTSSGLELLKSQQHQNVKAYQELDGQGRVSKLIVTTSSARDGDPAHCTEYIYSSPTSAFIKAWKETNTTWDSAWDADFTT